jgi:hypothetical protein
MMYFERTRGSPSYLMVHKVNLSFKGSVIFRNSLILCAHHLTLLGGGERQTWTVLDNFKRLLFT